VTNRIRQFCSTSPKNTEGDRRIKSKDLKELTKFRLSQLNTAGAFAMYAFHAPGLLGIFDSCVFISATMAIAMSSQAYNQIMEKDYDKMMVRTQNRPIP
jgi:protoheme IX farnesyltransferase